MVSPEPELQTQQEGASAHVLKFEDLATPSSLTVDDEKLPIEEHDDQSPRAEETVVVSTRRLYLMVLADFGLAFTWLCKFAVATPYFEHTLKAGPFLSHLVWIMGPLSGLIVAPVIGILSDRCTSSFGRRRPFILGGLIFCIVGLNVFANAARLTFGNLFTARVLAIIAFGVLDFSTNAIMFPSRALMGDLLPADHQHLVQSAAAVVASVAEVCAGAYVSSWKDPVTNIRTIFIVASALLAVSGTVSLVVCVEKPLSPDALRETVRRGDAPSCAPTGPKPIASSSEDTNPFLDVEKVGQCSEQRHTEDAQSNAMEAGDPGSEDEDIEDDESPTMDRSFSTEQHEDRLSLRGSETTPRCQSPSDGARQQEPSVHAGPMQQSVSRHLLDTIKTTVSNFPRPLVKVGLVYAFAWFLWFASLPYYSQWLGTDVLKGDPHAEPGSDAALAYQKGVRVFAIANVVKAALAMFFSAFYPTIITWIGAVGERVVFGFSFLLFSCALFSSANTTNVFVAASVIALGSVPFIATQTIPIALVIQRYPDNLASNLGVMNLFCVIPQLVDTLYTGKVAELAGESVVLQVAACWGFATALSAFLLL